MLKKMTKNITGIYYIAYYIW